MAFTHRTRKQAVTSMSKQIETLLKQICGPNQAYLFMWGPAGGKAMLTTNMSNESIADVCGKLQQDFSDGHPAPVPDCQSDA